MYDLRRLTIHAPFTHRIFTARLTGFVAKKEKKRKKIAKRGCKGSGPVRVIIVRLAHGSEAAEQRNAQGA
jgi:hypothetical protein